MTWLIRYAIKLMTKSTLYRQNYWLIALWLFIISVPDDVLYLSTRIDIFHLFLITFSNVSKFKKYIVLSTTKRIVNF